MAKTQGRYSEYLRPLNYLLDILLINGFAFLFLPKVLLSFYFSFFITLSWVIVSINVHFYEIFRFTKTISIVNQTVKQFLFFTLICFAFTGFYLNTSINKELFYYVTVTFITILTYKIVLLFTLKKYRSFFGGNYRNVIVLGSGDNISQLLSLFSNKSYGYQIDRTFQINKNKKEIITECLEYSTKSNIDIIFCSLKDLTKNEINQFVEYSEDTLINVKFVPENNEILSYNYKTDFYGYIPILSVQKTTLHEPVTKFIKRIFDIFFSLLIIIVLLSWLIPLLAFLIKIESSGPVFFKQGRPGIDEQEFFCYKFRSMMVNKTTEKEAIKNDPRVTRVGKFIRKTSLDEMPQFFNVLLGQMSVVGPRPHLWSQNKAYGPRIKKYMMRHYVKPGITGLAQVSGYRGEIQTDEDMIKRINYDIFYIENWSLILDLKIIFLTVFNIFKGEEKAY